MYSKFGFIDRPLNPSGVPRIERRYSPVGFEKELSRLRSAVSTFLKGSDNIAVVIIGQYGWGKSELLDALEVEASKLGLKVVRAPLTFGLDPTVMINTIVRSRGDPSQPLLVLIDEADEVSRVVSLGEVLKGEDVDKVKDLVIRLGSLIRALIEPRNYAQILNVDPKSLSRIMLVLAFTPQLYYNILKNIVPDVFDITRGRIYMEVPIDERIPLWLYYALLIQRFNAYSNDDRLKLIKNGMLSPLHPLRPEYLATLYEIISFMEGGTASPRGLVKFTSKLMDFLADKGAELNFSSFEEFLRQEVNGNELGVNLEVLDEGPNDETALKVFKALLLSGIPRTPEDLKGELGFDVSSALNALVKAGLAEEVYVVKVPFNNDSIERINELFLKLGHPPLSNDIRDLSINYGIYYTMFENEPSLYVILPPSDEFKAVYKGFKAYQVSAKLHRLFIYGKEPEEYLRVREEILRANEVFNEFNERLALEFINALMGSSSIIHKITSNTWVGASENPLDIRFGIIVSLGEELDAITKLLSKVINEGSITINGQEKVVDSLILVVLSKSLLTREIQERINELLNSSQWKGVLGNAADYIYPMIFGSDMLNNAREFLIGYRLDKLGKVPREFNVFIERFNALREDVAAFRDKVRQRVLQLTMAIRRGAKESKDSVIRRIVSAWIQGAELSDQPEIFRDSEGKARITPVEELFFRYLKSLGKGKFTIKELEYLIKRLFPTYLWREFRESDLIRLMILRGLLGPLSKDNDEVTIMTPDTSSTVIKVLYDEFEELKEKAANDITIDVKPMNMSIRIRAQINMGNDCEKQLNILKALPPNSQDFIKRYSMFMLCLDELKENVELSREKYLNELSAVTTKLNDDLESIISRANSMKKVLESIPSEVSTILTQKIDGLFNDIKNYLDKLNGLDLESFKETLPSIMESIDHEVSTIFNLIDIVNNIVYEIREYTEVASLIKNASRILGVKVSILDHESLVRDLVIIVRSNDETLMRNYLDELTHVIGKLRRDLSDYLTKVNGQIDKYGKIIMWFRKRASNEVLLKLRINDKIRDIKASPNLENAEEIVSSIRSIDDAIRELSNRINVPGEVITAIASLGPNVGIDENDLSKSLGIDLTTINKYLEILWKYGLIDRKYVT